MRQSLRLAIRPALAYLLFCIGGFAAFFGALVVYEGNSHLGELLLACTAGIAGVVVGQFVAVSRVRFWPTLLAYGAIGLFGGFLLSLLSHSLPHIPDFIVIPIVFFCMAFPCGHLSLQHRGEIFASFWPAVGWIGGVFVILNRMGRVTEWERDKASAWLPVPLAFLFGFLVCLLVYLAAKQAVRVELWQALSGAVGRRVSKRATVTAVPRGNVFTLFVVAFAIFAITAVLAPYLWRTGKGDREGENRNPREKTEQTQDTTPPRSRVDENWVVEQLEELAKATGKATLNLWPLLLLWIAYRPTKRALLNMHLLRPIVPTPPTERIDNGWQYVRIAAEDAGVMPLASDSVEQLLERIRDKNLGGPAVDRAAEIYTRTRYGFVVAPGDATAMPRCAREAGKELRKNLSIYHHLQNLWRPLS